MFVADWPTADEGVADYPLKNKKWVLKTLECLVANEHLRKLAWPMSRHDDNLSAKRTLPKQKGVFMDELINKIVKIQNKQNSLLWGHYKQSDIETMFAVGHKSYPKEPHFFITTSNYEIFLVTDVHKKELYRQCIDVNDVVAGIITLLKEWFPAK